MAVLVTGAGLIGAGFAREAIARGEEVIFLDPEPRADYLRFKLGDSGWKLLWGDVRDLPMLTAVMTEHKVSAVVHTAGLIGGKVQKSLFHAFDINLGGTRNVAEAVRLTGVKRLVHMSTMGVYDTRRASNTNVPEDFWRGAGRGYGNYKAAKELILETYANEYKFELLMIRPANVYGFGHFFAGSSGGMKMQALLEAGMNGGIAKIPSSETMANEYIYWKDIGRAVDIAVRSPMPKDRIFNTGNGYVTPFEDVVGAVRKLCPQVSFEIEKGEPPKSKAQAMDIARAKAQLGWEPQYSIDAGFADYLEEMERARSFFGKA
ncbi:MAG: NAD-dependent epimerase/dehydratase family protein [Beijerinckiaceae bacterium]